MIITCPNCNKQFKIEKSQIPDEGRDLQCGSCNNIWFYEIEKNKNEILNLKEEIENKEDESKLEKIKENIIEKKKSLEKNPEKQEIKKISKSTKKEKNKFFSYLIVLIISFAALIILIDTLKNPLITVFPGLEIILFNLFETLKDIKLFIIDLI